MLKLEIVPAQPPDDSELAARFDEMEMSYTGRGWPPPRAALSALVDLGMSDEQLALYFWIDVDCVKCFRGRFDRCGEDAECAEPSEPGKRSAQHRTLRRHDAEL